MKIKQLADFLNKKYTVSGFVDLAELSKTPQAAYQFFYSLYQSEFDVNDRIILYSSNSIPDEFLQHLYQVANFVDISNWFILICTPTDILGQLSTLAEKFSSDPVPFQHFKIAIDQTSNIENQYHLPETICAIPWMHLEIRNDGAITPCCMSNGKSIGNITSVSLDQAFQGDYMQSLRQQFLEGKKPTECVRCWSNEERGLSSIRTHNIKRLKKQFLLEHLNSPSITSIDIKFNNTCNFKCRICAPVSSSLIAAENKKFRNIPIAPQNNWGESDEFINQMIKKLPHLTNIDMFGGEPFLIKKFANVLKIAVEQGHAKNIRLHYNSNGSIWPGSFLEYWPHFKEVDIHFSIDAIGKRFELQRGGVWKEVEDNILRIKNLNLPNMSISLMPTISIMSVYYLDEVYEWAQQYNFKLFASNLTTPSGFGLANLTANAQQIIINKFQNHPWEEIQNVLEFIRSSPPGTGKKFLDQIKWFDSIRQENFSKSHFEIAEAMEYVYNNKI